MGKDRFHYNASGGYKGKTSDTGPGFDWSGCITPIVSLAIVAGVLYFLGQVVKYLGEHPWLAIGIAVFVVFMFSKVFK